MAFGRSSAPSPGTCPAVRRLVRLAAALCVLALVCALPAFAQDSAAEGSAGRGRVPVEGAPASLNADLNRLLREEPAPTSLFEARRQADRAAETVARLMESEGYYAADVDAFAEGVDVFSRSVRVVHGPLFTYVSRRIDYTGSAPDPATQSELDALLDPLSPGVPARAQPVIDVGDALVARLRAQGYPDARADPVDALADAREQTVELAYKLQPGLRYSFGDVRVSGLGRTRPEFIETLKPWGPGERYSPAKLDEFRNRLAETGVFASAVASLEPATDADATAADAASQTASAAPPSRDVLLDIEERERRTIALGASASTSEGAGVEAEWELRNITGRGDSINTAARLATLERRIGATYSRPHIGRYGRNLSLGIEAEDFETDAFDQTGANISATIEERITPRVRGSLGVEAGYASIDDSRTRARINSDRREIYILSAAATADYIGVRDVLDPQDGVRARLSVEPGVTYGDTNIAFTRLSGEVSLYSDIGNNDRLTGALRGRLGTIAGPQGAPPDRLFYAGGGGSVRGYEYQSLSPRDALNIPIGGRSLIETSAELRWRQSERLGYVAFIDAGAAGPDTSPPLEDMRAGVGLGARYYAGFGPLRADIAIPLDKREGDADFQIYLSIGQAF